MSFPEQQTTHKEHSKEKVERRIIRQGGAGWKKQKRRLLAFSRKCKLLLRFKFILMSRVLTYASRKAAEI